MRSVLEGGAGVTRGGRVERSRCNGGVVDLVGGVESADAGGEGVVKDILVELGIGRVVVLKC